jgi:hypothetical protein
MSWPLNVISGIEEREITGLPERDVRDRVFPSQIHECISNSS